MLIDDHISGRYNERKEKARYITMVKENNIKLETNTKDDLICNSEDKQMHIRAKKTLSHRCLKHLLQMVIDYNRITKEDKIGLWDLMDLPKRHFTIFNTLTYGKDEWTKITRNLEQYTVLFNCEANERVYSNALRLSDVVHRHHTTEIISNDDRLSIYLFDKNTTEDRKRCLQIMNEYNKTKECPKIPKHIAHSMRNSPKVLMKQNRINHKRESFIKHKYHLSYTYCNERDQVEQKIRQNNQKECDSHNSQTQQEDNESNNDDKKHNKTNEDRESNKDDSDSKPITETLYGNIKREREKGRERLVIHQHLYVHKIEDKTIYDRLESMDIFSFDESLDQIHTWKKKTFFEKILKTGRFRIIHKFPLDPLIRAGADITITIMNSTNKTVTTDKEVKTNTYNFEEMMDADEEFRTFKHKFNEFEQWDTASEYPIHILNLNWEITYNNPIERIIRDRPTPEQSLIDSINNIRNEKPNRYCETFGDKLKAAYDLYIENLYAQDFRERSRHKTLYPSIVSESRRHKIEFTQSFNPNRQQSKQTRTEETKQGENHNWRKQERIVEQTPQPYINPIRRLINKIAQRTPEEKIQNEDTIN